MRLLWGESSFDSQKRILNGIIEKAKEDQADIYVFSCDVWSYSTTQFITGEMEIYKLPDFTNYDGVIIHGDTLYNAETIANIVQNVHDAGVPCVNLTLEVEGMANLSMENDNGITLLINHLVEKHGAKTINFISGPEGNSDGEGRVGMPIRRHWKSMEWRLRITGFILVITILRVEWRLWNFLQIPDWICRMLLWQQMMRWHSEPCTNLKGVGIVYRRIS